MSSSERTPLLVGSQAPPLRLRHPKPRLDDHLDLGACTFPLALQCFVSGLANCISFTSSNTWVGFMTGNLTQLAISSMAYLRCLLRSWLTSSSSPSSPSLSPSPLSASSWLLDLSQREAEHKAKAVHRIIFSSTALASFCLGAYLTAHIRCPFTLQRSTRGRYVLVSALQTLATLLVLLLLVLPVTRLSLQEDPLLLSLLSLSLGSQSIMGLSVGSKAYSTTVVFTSPLSQLVSAAVFPLYALPTSTTLAKTSSISTGQEEEKTRRTSISTARHQTLSILLLMAGAAVGSLLIELQSSILPTGEGGEARGGTEGSSRDSLQFYPLLLLAATQALLVGWWWLAVAKKEERHEGGESEEEGA